MTSPNRPTDPGGPTGAPPGPARDRPLEELRNEIHDVDRRLISLFADRVHLAREIGARKRTHGGGPLDPGQEAGVIRRAGELARERGLPEDDVRQIFWLLVGMSRQAQDADR
jgi:chorismate mutase